MARKSCRLRYFVVMGEEGPKPYRKYISAKAAYQTVGSKRFLKLRKSACASKRGMAAAWRPGRRTVIAERQ